MRRRNPGSKGASLNSGSGVRSSCYRPYQPPEPGEERCSHGPWAGEVPLTCSERLWYGARFEQGLVNNDSRVGGRQEGDVVEAGLLLLTCQLFGRELDLTLRDQAALVRYSNARHVARDG